MNLDTTRAAIRKSLGGGDHTRIQVHDELEELGFHDAAVAVWNDLRPDEVQRELERGPRGPLSILAMLWFDAWKEDRW